MSMYDGYSKAGLIFGGTGGGGGGTSDYTRLSNLPKINGTTITGNLDADTLGLANCKYYTLVVANEEDELYEGGNDLDSDVNKFVDANGTELAIADVYLDMMQFVTEDKSNIAVINVTFADEDEPTGHTATLMKLFYSAIDTDEGGLQFYAKAGNVEFTSLVKEDEVTFNMRDVDFVVHGILTMTSETSATISDLTADYDDIMEAIDSGSSVKLTVVVYSSLVPIENGTIFELNHIIYNKNLNIIEFEGLESDRLFQVIIESPSQDVTTTDVVITKIQNKYISNTVTLLSSAWTNNTQTVSVEGMVSDALVQVSPVASDVETYAKAKIICTTQGNGTLTFTCGTVPTSNVSVTVVNWGA